MSVAHPAPTARLILGLGMALEMDFNALGQQPLAATLTAAGKDCPAVFGFHTGAEAKLLLARALGWLVSAFHSACKFLKKSGNLSGWLRLVNSLKPEPFQNFNRR